MHDIICPHCGESFIASDVAFDLSEYILPLLYSNPKESEDVKSVGFRYYVDEDTISKHTVPENTTPLRCDRPGGPNFSDPWFPFVVTNEMIFKYIESELAGIFPVGESLTTLLTQIKEIKSTRGATYSPTQINIIQTIYHRFFSVSKGNLETIDPQDANVQIALNILLFIHAHPELSISLRVRLYSSKRNPKRPDYSVPDILFVNSNGIVAKRHYKCCRYCGTSFPSEYGYYKMIPVVLLGSHYAGKTSYLLSLLYTVNEMPPFAHDGVGNKSITATTLNEDNDLVAFSKNIGRFKRGEDPDKTDFTNVPILNLLINNIIYTFIDWPGEKFIDGELRKNDNFVYQTRRVILKARHFFCFLEPSQIDLNRKEREESVRFDTSELAGSFDWHMQLPDEEKIRSVNYIVNKIDLFTGDEENAPNPNAHMILDLATGKSETSVYSSGNWNRAEFEAICNETNRFLTIQNPTLSSSLRSITERFGSKFPVSYVPVAPYGENGKKDAGSVVHKTRLAGIPLLHIMEVDKELLTN